MKKFRFPLENALKYKNKLLDSLKAEHAALLAQVYKQEQRISDLEEEYDTLNRELNEKNARGISPLEIQSYKRYMNIIEHKIADEYEILEELKEEAEAKKAEVIQMKQETASLEKLKEKRMSEYQKEAIKEEERAVDEIVANRRFREGLLDL